MAQSPGVLIRSLTHIYSLTAVTLLIEMRVAHGGTLLYTF